MRLERHCGRLMALNGVLLEEAQRGGLKDAPGGEDGGRQKGGARVASLLREAMLHLRAEGEAARATYREQVRRPPIIKHKPPTCAAKR